METPRGLFLVIMTISYVRGNDVTVGVLGNSASIQCKLPVSETLVWDSSDSAVIAVNGSVVDSVSHKYMIVKQNGVQESLVIHNLTLEDEKTFRCYDLKNISIKEVSELHVLVRPPSMYMTVPKETLIEGEHVTFVCQADGGKPLPEITWHRIGVDGSMTRLSGEGNDVLYKNGTGLRKSSLTIKVTREIYLSTFTCNITLPVFYQQGFEATPDIMLAPRQPSIIGYTGMYDADVLLKLACISTGSRPAAELGWLLDGARLSDTEVVVMPERDGTFTVRSFLSQRFSYSENGTRLTCAVTNRVLTQQNAQPLTDNLTLTVSHKPVIFVYDTHVASIEGGSLTMWCHVDAVPYPDELSWRHEGQVVDRRFYVTTNDSSDFGLTLSNVSRSDAGPYTCHASNRLGSATSAAITMSLHFPPTCAEETPLTVAVAVGKIARLHCRLLASPQNVTVTWQRRGSPNVPELVTSEVRLLDSDIVSAELELGITSSADYGTVLCYGENGVGISPSPCVFHIVQPGPPSHPSDCKARTSASAVTIYCQPGFDGGSPQSFVLQELENSGFDSKLNNTTPTFSFTLSRDTSVRVCAMNALSIAQVCTEPLSVVYIPQDNQNSDPVYAKETSAAVFVAGGITAFAGLLIFSGIFVYLLRRNNKAEQHNSLEKGESRPTSSPGDYISRILSAVRPGRAEKADLIKDIPARQETQYDVRTETPARCSSQHVSMEISSDATIPYEDIVMLASTPYVPGRYGRHWGHTSDLSPVPAPPLTAKSSYPSSPPSENDQTPDLLNESTGFFMSGIELLSSDSEGSNCLHVSTAAPDGTKSYGLQMQLHQTSARTPGVDYSAADIADVLDGTIATALNERYAGHTHASTDFGDTRSVMTLDKDYTAGDIASVLDKFEDSPTLSLVSELDMTSYIIDGTRLSFDADFSESGMDSYPTRERDTPVRRHQRTMKSLSLPFRLRKLAAENIMKTRRPSSVATELRYSNIPPCARFDRATLQKLERANFTTSCLSPNTCATASEEETTRPMSSAVGDADTFMFDIDQFTLTVTSESGGASVFVDEDTADEDEATIVEATLTWLSGASSSVTVDTSSEYNNVSIFLGDLRSPVRNESFIKAISFHHQPSADDSLQCEGPSPESGTIPHPASDATN